MPDFKIDLKEPEETTTSDSLPSPVQMTRLPSTRVSTTRNVAYSDVFARPRNNVVISRAFGALKLDGMRVIVDPNVHIPKSLLRKSFISYSDPPPTNLELRVTFGAIAADVEVRPFAPGTVHKVPERSYLSRDSGREPHQVHLNFGTFTGSATLRIHAPKTAHIYMETSATFGQTRIYLPRTFHGPLTICSWVRAPRLSAELRRACVPVSEDGCTMRWFVGDVGAWSANNEHGDSAKADTAFGNVWVGYVGEEEEGAGALDGTLVHWARNTLGLLLIFCAMYWIPVLLWRLIAAVLSSIF